MKKIGIITHYDVHNHGALLQLTALIRVLAAKGYEAKALRFDKNYDFMGHDLKAKYDVSAKSVGIYMKYLKEKGMGCTVYNFRKRHTLNDYKSRAGLIGDYYSESGQLDGVIVGSDEVFALHTGPTPVMFGHCLPTDAVMSYAGSFGPTTYEDICRLHSENFVRSGIEGMKYVTVRDGNSADVVERLTGERPAVVVDPVLLYGYKDEIAGMKAPKVGDCLLVYSYDNRMNSPEEVKAITEYAHGKGLKTLSPGFYHKWCDYNIDVDPIELLSYFKNAAEVVTDTFHGSVMSLITGARFVAKTRESNHLKLVNLLEEYGVADRIITRWDDLAATMDKPMDYEKINEEIERRRSESMAHLDKMLEFTSDKA
ncbi:MAG: polysaccharide pyruvyl transferase family protein [Duncaniella sp.]|nr:polysaccharide pyruvyl transferase family protein [Duncaniella sp.]